MSALEYYPAYIAILQSWYSIDVIAARVQKRMPAAISPSTATMVMNQETPESLSRSELARGLCSALAVTLAFDVSLPAELSVDGLVRPS